MEWEVKHLIDHLRQKSPKDIVCATIWSREDVPYILSELSSDGYDTSSADVDELWDKAREIILDSEDKTISVLSDELYYTFRQAIDKETANV